MKPRKIAIIADWLIDFWWAELVISHLLEAFPEADIYTSVCFMDHPMLEWRNIYTSWLQKVPFLNRRHKLAGILRPFAFRSFDLSEYDIIISSSSAESKNAGFKNPQSLHASSFTKGAKKPLHICYCHTPIRYYWSHYAEYRNMMEFGFLNPLARFILDHLINWLRKLDYEAAQRVDFFIANSENTRERIQKYYHRESEVIYPGVEVRRHCEEWSNPEHQKGIPHSDWIASPARNDWNKDEYYISVGRCIPYKKFDLLVDAFNQNGKKLILCTATDTPLFWELKEKSKPNIEWKFRVSNKEKDTLMQWARAFLFPPLEDFGLVPIEAMAMGTPVIAYGEWWALETVMDTKTGTFFSPQTPEALNTAIEKFEKMTFDPEIIKNHARWFSKEIFQEKIQQFITKYGK